MVADLVLNCLKQVLNRNTLSRNDDWVDTPTKQTDHRRTIGEIGESAVRRCVVSWNWHLVDHNVRWRDGELDVIAIDDRTLVFIEVKTLRAKAGSDRAAFSPFESIDRRKQAQLRKLAKRYLSDDIRRVRMDDGLRIEAFRFDAFAVIVGRDDQVLSIEHLEQAF